MFKSLVQAPETTSNSWVKLALLSTCVVVLFLACSQVQSFYPAFTQSVPSLMTLLFVGFISVIYCFYPLYTRLVVTKTNYIKNI